MSTDLRKWINLVEDNRHNPNTWYSEQDMFFGKYRLIDYDKHYSKWRHMKWTMIKATDDWTNGKPSLKDFKIISDMFQKYVKEELKPIWITDIHVHNDSGWNFKFDTIGEDDPDEY